MPIYLGGSLVGPVTTNLQGSGFQHVNDYLTMRGIVSPANNDTVFVRGRLSPRDGGEGTWQWVQGSIDLVDGGTVLASVSGATGRWVRIYEYGTFNAKWFATADEIIAFCAANAGTMYFPPGVYSFVNKVLPGGVYYVGPGWRFANTDAYFGVGGPASAVLLGPIRQGQASSGGGFKRLVVVGGLSVESPHTEIERCAFTGITGSLKFDQTLPATPSYCQIRGCLFSCVSGAPSILLRGSASGNMFSGNTVIVNHAERGIVAELSTNAPTKNTFNDISFYDGCNALSVGSYLYGDFKYSSFRCNTSTTATVTFADTTPFVFGANSSNNKIQLTGAETYTNTGSSNVFTT